jgi:dipeptidase E
VKLLLTDSGVSNASILAALVDLLGRPIAEARALCIPTAGYGGPYGDPDGPWSFISGQSLSPMTKLGWKSVGVLELTALPSISKERWVSWVRESDVLLVNGGETLYLCHWMRESGLADLFPSLRDTVYVGLSAGSMVLTPRIGEHFASRNPRADGDDSTLGLVDFSIFPHLDSPDRTMAEAEQWAAGIKGPAYAIDSQTAIKVTDGSVEVISEGYWKLFNAAVLRSATLLSQANGGLLTLVWIRARRHAQVAAAPWRERAMLVSAATAIVAMPTSAAVV